MKDISLEDWFKMVYPNKKPSFQQKFLIQNLEKFKDLKVVVCPSRRAGIKSTAEAITNNVNRNLK